MQREDIKMLVKKWWDIYNDESLDYKKVAGVAGAGRVVGPGAALGSEGVNVQPFIDALSSGGMQTATFNRERAVIGKPPSNDGPAFYFVQSKIPVVCCGWN
ncbi:hypothetical protein ACFX2I_037236 [Malus domestica]